ncbi:hypothetical protein Leryth_012324 [Lithospermum erythrorhizon]|uniref:Deacetylase n=1 Tax=Lithospermum erythrorhizon TaxID=34254 RepID=A0AAV3PYE0_LITER|nr:hypothetical protein Leryth_012324 [Lithospermum erythrorhizon]
MEASSNMEEVLYEFLPYGRVYKNGIVERLIDTDSIPALTDIETGVSSKDVSNIIPDSEVYVRLYLPNDLIVSAAKKLPVLVYFHGGAFIIATPSCSKYHNYLNALVAEAQVVAVSVHYRRPPEHPLPIAYEDSLAALQWVASHQNGNGPEAWLNDHADFDHVFLAGDSAGANIAHNLALSAGNVDFLPPGVNILGIALIHPYFWGSEAIGSESLEKEKKDYLDKLWPLVCPSDPDRDHPWINPVAEDAPSLAGLNCKRVLVCVAEKDILKDRGWLYYQILSKSGWLGVAEIQETEGEAHCFHLSDLKCENATNLMRRLAGFFNRDKPYL